MMLLSRSWFCHATLLVFLQFAASQEYESNYKSDYGDEDHEEYNEESDGPDYSKYFSSETSAPLVAKSASSTGFVNPSEFSNFFGPSNFEFGASNNQEVSKGNSPGSQELNGFVSPHELKSGFTQFKSSAPYFGTDYFEKATKKEQKDDKYPASSDQFETKPGPSYISKALVPPQNKVKYDYEPKNYKYSNKDEYEKIEDADKLKYNNQKKEEYKPVYSAQLQPVSPTFATQYTQAAATPYQKYSFQTPKIPTQVGYQPYNPALSYNSNQQFKSAVPNYEFASTNQATKLLANGNCKKVNKQLAQKESNGRIKRQSMDCYVCKNPQSGATYEQCSYGEEPKPKSYYYETSQSYSKPAVYDASRYKRYARKDDPYEYVKAQSKKYYAQSDDDNGENEEKDKYFYGPEQYTFDDEEISDSEKQSEQLVKSGEHCKKVDQPDGSVCTVCKDPKTGGSYEKCSYASEPEEKKYAYVRERKYDSDDEKPEEYEEESESSENKPRKHGKKYKGEKNSRPYEVERVTPYSTRRPTPLAKKSLKKQNDYDVPEHFIEDNRNNQNVGKLYGSADTSQEHKEKPLESPDSDQYYYKHFPDYSKSASQRREHKAKSNADDEYGYYGEGSQKDVEEVLAEFAKKDRSQCQKAEKNGMTCYLCTDKKGLQHEECMYVSESRPKSTYASYHAKVDDNRPLKERANQQTEEINEESQRSEVKANKEPKVSTSRRSVHKVIPQDTVSTENKKVVAAIPPIQNKSKPARVYRRNKNIPTTTTTTLEPPAVESSEAKTDSKTSETKDKYYVEGENGAFTHETRPVYSRKFRDTLPRFMLERSEGERIYDALVKNKS